MVWAFVAILLGQADAAVKTDEVVSFFPTFAHLDEETRTWVLNIHGWIYEPEMDSLRRRMALGLLRRALDLDKEAEETALFKQRAGTFLVDNERGKRVAIKLGDRTITLNDSDERGHFLGTVRLHADEAQKLLAAQKSKDRRLTFQAVLPEGDQRTIEGSVQLIDIAGLSVISDVDDTIKISEVRNKKALLANTFLREFAAVPGMAAVYEKWAEAGVTFHYVSASPWQLYAFLAEFREHSKFPPGSFHMKTFRWKDSSFLSLLSSPEKYKPGVIEPIFKTFPGRRFVLVGDSGEKDPEIYADLARKYPKQVARILIRDVTDEDAAAGRYRKCFAGLQRELWTIFRDPATIKQVVAELAGGR